MKFEMTEKSIYFIGECMVEMRRDNNVLHTGFGGDTLNAAVYLSRLTKNKPITVNYVSALGKDSLSDEMIAFWQSEGLRVECVQRFDDKLPGLYLIETDANGERRFHFWRNDSAARYWLQGAQVEAVKQALLQASYIYLSGITLAILSRDDKAQLLALLKACRQNGAKIIFDNNYRPKLWENAHIAAQIYSEVLALTDIALLTIDDEAMIYGAEDCDQILKRTRALGVSEIVIKRGALSCVVQTPVETIEVAALQVPKVVDTTAAGDSFGAAYIATRIMGGAPSQAAHAGHQLAGAVIAHRGAIIDISTMPTS